MKNCSRELNNFRVADRFLRYTLCINETEKIEKYSKEIAQAEMLQNNIVENLTQSQQKEYYENLRKQCLFIREFHCISIFLEE